MRGIRIAIFAVIVGVAVALPPAASSQLAVHQSGLSSFALFRQTDASGCLVTELENQAGTGREAVSGQGSHLRTDLVAFITVFDVCAGTVERFLTCFSSPGDPIEVAIDPELAGASVSGTITCTDFDTGATCTLTKSETLVGVGEITTVREHFVRREDFFLLDVFRGKIRAAEVTEATITGCGVSFSEEDLVFAQLQNAVSTGVQIVR